MDDAGTSSSQKHLGEHDDVRPGSKTEGPGLARHVRFTLRSRYRQPAPACPVCVREADVPSRARRVMRSDMIYLCDANGRAESLISPMDRAQRRDNEACTSGYQWLC